MQHNRLIEVRSHVLHTNLTRGCSSASSDLVAYYETCQGVEDEWQEWGIHPVGVQGAEDGPVIVNWSDSTRRAVKVKRGGGLLITLTGLTLTAKHDQ